MTYAHQRKLPVLALLLAAGLGASAPSAALAQGHRVDPLARELSRELSPDDPRWSKGDGDVARKRRLIDWVSGRLYIVRPSEPGPNRKAELAFEADPAHPDVLTVRRRVLGTTRIIEGKAHLRRVQATLNRLRSARRHVLLLEVEYAPQGLRGARGALGQEAAPTAARYAGRYAIRAKGNVLLGRTTAPGADGQFEEKGLSQGIRYRRAGSLMDYLAGADEAEKARMKALQEEEVKTHCWVMEFSASAEENTSIRRENLGGVAFYFNPPEEIAAALALDKPRHVFVVAHGWQNDRGLSLEFASKLVKGLRARLAKDGVPKEQAELVFVSWNSKRANFMESALCAETIGHRGVAPLLRELRQRLPSTSVTLVGHSLGGRMMLAALQGPNRKIGAIGRWKQRRFRAMALSGRDALDGAFWRMLHLALRGRRAPAPDVHAVVLLEAAIDVQTLHADIGLLNYGDTPDAPEHAKLIVNAHSRNDEILRLAYTASNGVMNLGSTIMKLLDDGDGIQALGRLGAERAPGQQFASLKLTSQKVDHRALRRALADPLARPVNAPQHRVLNVDVTALLPHAGDAKPDGGAWGKVDTHTGIFQPAIFDLIWQATTLGGRTASAK